MTRSVSREEILDTVGALNAIAIELASANRPEDSLMRYSEALDLLMDIEARHSARYEVGITTRPNTSDNGETPAMGLGCISDVGLLDPIPVIDFNLCINDGPALEYLYQTSIMYNTALVCFIQGDVCRSVQLLALSISIDDADLRNDLQARSVETAVSQILVKIYYLLGVIHVAQSRANIPGGELSEHGFMARGLEFLAAAYTLANESIPEYTDYLSLTLLAMGRGLAHVGIYEKAAELFQEASRHIIRDDIHTILSTSSYNTELNCAPVA
jgi:tetratricopeptide (TPR) repeat protein